MAKMDLFHNDVKRGLQDDTRNWLSNNESRFQANQISSNITFDVILKKVSGL
jgi:hypothetical protein